MKIQIYRKQADDLKTRAHQVSANTPARNKGKSYNVEPTGTNEVVITGIDISFQEVLTLAVKVFGSSLILSIPFLIILAMISMA